MLNQIKSRNENFVVKMNYPAQAARYQKNARETISRRTPRYRGQFPISWIPA